MKKIEKDAKQFEQTVEKEQAKQKRMKKKQPKQKNKFKQIKKNKKHLMKKLNNCNNNKVLKVLMMYALRWIWQVQVALKKPKVQLILYKVGNAGGGDDSISQKIQMKSTRVEALNSKI